MRKATQKKIDSLHAEIARLIQMEKDYWDRKNPDANSLYQQIAHTQIEFGRHSPEIKSTFVLQGGSGYEHNYD